jgi:hypothetical protein
VKEQERRCVLEGEREASRAVLESLGRNCPMFSRDSEWHTPGICCPFIVIAIIPTCMCTEYDFFCYHILLQVPVNYGMVIEWLWNGDRMAMEWLWNPHLIPFIQCMLYLNVHGLTRSL